ncbi:MAG: hypothetical protein U9N56_03415 [Actinomycetota bacterium]|nr:hypothetical protein [Actinomycetota bacterium]
MVDTPTAREFTHLALERVSEAELDTVAGKVEFKAERLSELLDPDRLSAWTEDDATETLRWVFSARRKAPVILNTLGLVGLGEAIEMLIRGQGPVARRLEFFHDTIVGVGRGVPETMGFDLGSELLHFSDPDRHWLWTRWMWNPESETGSLPLIVMEEVEIDGGSVAETYNRIGLAMAFVDEVGAAAGFRTPGHGVFGTDVFLASVYAVYMYTTLRMRMTQEFNRVIPELGELVSRLLGVHRLEAMQR